MIWWLLGTARADCSFHAGLDDVNKALEAAEQAYVSLDVALFEKATTEVDFVVPCLEVPLDPATAARLHRLRGLGRFAEGDTTGAVAAMATARTLEPQYTFPTDMLPEGFELRVLYEGLPPEPSSDTVRLPRPRGGSLLIDGQSGRQLARDRSALFQRAAGDQIVETLYLTPDDEVPWYPGLNKRRTVLAITSLSTAAIATGLYAAAFDAKNHLGDATGNDDLLRRASTTNVLTGLSVGVFGAAGAQAVVAVVLGPP